MIQKSLGLTGLLLAAAASALGVCWPGSENRPSLLLPGLVETQEIRLGSKVGGRVAEVAIAEGAMVEPGQVLVRFDVPELRAQRDQWLARVQLFQAQRDRARNGPRAEEKSAAQAAAASARARWQRLVNGSRQEEIDQTRHDLKALEADYHHSHKEWERARRLYLNAASAQGDLDLAQCNFERNRGRLQATRARLDLLLAGSRAEEIAEAEAELQRAEANARLLEQGTRYEEIAEAEANLADAQARLRECEVNLEESVVRASARAVVEAVSVRPGDLVAANQVVVTVLRAEDLWVKVFVSEVDLARVRLNQEAQVTIDAFPSRRFAGKVEQIAAKCEFTPRNVQSLEERRHQVFGLKVRVPDPEGIFKSGLAAMVSLPLGGD